MNDYQKLSVEFEDRAYVRSFVRESNKIEGIDREPTEKEVDAHIKFRNLSQVKIKDLKKLVKVCQPGAVLRDKKRMNVSIGSHTPLAGGKNVVELLDFVLDLINKNELSSYNGHCSYEELHPFTDGNGRSGRALWMWQEYRYKNIQHNEFLRQFYYQTLSRFSSSSNNKQDEGV